MPELDILLIYPALSVNERYGNRDFGKVGGHLPPLGILSIASYLREKGYCVEAIDALVRDLNPKELKAYIRDKKPKVIGISAITPIFHRVVSCAKEIKEEFPNLLIVIGGHHSTIMPRQVLEQNEYFDIAAFGEGELTMAELIREYKASSYDYKTFLKNYASLKAIDGIAFRQEDETIVNKDRSLIENLDDLPFPARDLVPMKEYIPLPNQYKRLPLVHMVVIRGCPYQCSFCSNNAVFGKKIRARSPQKVVDEIKSLIIEYNAKDISFWDDMMTADKRWMHEFCELIIQNKIDITWTCYSRVDTITRELLEKMADAGCWNIFFGYEAGDQQLLDNLGKGTTLAQIRNANKWCKEVGIEVRASFMLALPGETSELAQKTIDFAKELSPEYAQFCITTPYPGTRLFDEALKWGKLSNDYSEYNIWEPVFIPFGYKDKETILKMEKSANSQFYLRPKAVFNLIKKIKSWEDIKRYLKGFRVLMGFIKK